MKLSMQTAFSKQQQLTTTGAFVLFVVGCLCVSGCGSGADGKCLVTGTVTWNDEPIKSGFISFRPLDGKHSSEAGPIADGRFSFYAHPGNNRVEIRASKEAGYNDSMRQPILVDYIPSKYNLESTLSADVAANGSNSFEFPLTD